MASIDTAALKNRYLSGVVVLYSLRTAGEFVVLRTASPDGGEPQEGRGYMVEFRDAETHEVLETRDTKDGEFPESGGILSLMDDLAEDYLRNGVRRWESYVAQSGRCAPEECNPNLAEAGEVERTVIRGDDS